MGGFALRVEIRLKLRNACSQVRWGGFKFKSAMSTEDLLHLFKIGCVIRAQMDDATWLQEPDRVTREFPID